MDPALLIPAAESIPVHWAWFDTLLVTTFTLHVLLMNAVVGATAVALFARGGDAPAPAAPPAADLKDGLTILLALTVNFGVAPLLFLQVNWGQFDYVSSVLMGGWWLCLPFLVIVAYYALYLYKFRFERRAACRTALPALVLAILFFVGFLFTNNMTLMIRPEAWPAYFDHPIVFNWGDPTLWPRWLHMMTGALAVGGLYAAIRGRAVRNDALTRTGLKWFTHATLANLAFGLWFLFMLPQAVLLQFMGGSLPATGALVLGLAAAGLMLAAGFKGQVGQSAAFAVLAVLCMAVARHFVRVFSLAPLYHPRQLTVTGQVSPLILFLVILAIGLVLIGWMLSAWRRAGKEA
ncbi:MAG: hypothetical protein AB7D57_03710 [Desulfovibrionaceae bacterium]